MSKPAAAKTWARSTHARRRRSTNAQFSFSNGPTRICSPAALARFLRAACPRPCRLYRCPAPPRGPLCAHRLLRGVSQTRAAPFPRTAAGLPRKSQVRSGLRPLAFQSARRGSRPGRTRLSARRRLLRFRSRLWREFHSRPSRLRQTNGDGLLRRSRTVLALTDVLDLFVDELAGLRGRRLPLPSVGACPFERFLLGHVYRPPPPCSVFVSSQYGLVP
jgi:hypothetical protein